MIFMAKVCPKAINVATAESIHQLLALRPHPMDRIGYRWALVGVEHLTMLTVFFIYNFSSLIPNFHDADHFHV